MYEFSQYIQNSKATIFNFPSASYHPKYITISMYTLKADKSTQFFTA